MTLSIVIPTYTFSYELELMAYNCARCYRKLCDQLIITEDGGQESQSLWDIADVYIYNNKNTGFTANVNRGWEDAGGDYVAIVNSDTLWEFGDPQDLCIPGRVTSPVDLALTPRQLWSRGIMYDPNHLKGEFFVVPETVRKERGMLDKSFVMYHSDTDYRERTKDIFVPIYSVGIVHKDHATVKGLKNMDEQIKKDEQVLYTKYPYMKP